MIKGCSSFGWLSLAFLMCPLACTQIARHQDTGKPCLECHAGDLSRAGGLDHQQEGFPTDCEQCHPSKDQWTPVSFDHQSFPLDGKHAALSCNSCHDKDPLPTTCVGCHEADRSRPTSPDHLADGFNTNCDACHTTAGWDVVKMGCNACHGSAASDAPPASVGGSFSTSDRGVGAHQVHLVSSTWRAAVSCSACHLVPQSIADAGHSDTALPAETTFTGLAVADGASPTWTGTTCSGTYCHGATLSGGSHTAPTWTQVDGSQSTCHSCHGFPPENGHPAGTSCGGCHGQVVDSNNAFIAPDRHIDGKVDVSGAAAHPSGWSSAMVHGPAFLSGPSGCTSCHGADLKGGSAGSCESCHSNWQNNCTFCHGGQDNSTGAPPWGVDGESSTFAASVGRHTSHVMDGATHGVYGCSTCHKIPTNALSAGHIDASPAELAFSGLAAGSTYNPGTAQCQNVYCHGNGKLGSTGQASWTGGLSGGCSACHDDESDGENMSLSGKHKKHVDDKGFGCSSCHGCVVNSSKVITDTVKHVNGSPDVCLSAWNPSTRRCSTNACHGGEDW